MRNYNEISRKGWDKRGRKHGLSDHPLYNTWFGMVRRCYLATDTYYADYGGRGIMVCEEWRYLPTKFIEHAMSIGWKSGYSIDRINNDGDYEPSNIRIATAAMQSANTRRNKRVKFEGKNLLLKEWADETGFSYECLHARIKRGWSIQRALTQPLQRRRMRHKRNAGNSGKGLSTGTVPPASPTPAPAN